jgi:hypothetical protein
MRLILALLLLSLSACKGDAVKCEKGCRNFATLTFWKVAEGEIARATPDQRDAMRKSYLEKFNTELERGITLCVTQCQSANNTDDIDCLIGAKTADQAQACFK